MAIAYEDHGKWGVIGEARKRYKESADEMGKWSGDASDGITGFLDDLAKKLKKSGNAGNGRSAFANSFGDAPYDTEETYELEALADTLGYDEVPETDTSAAEQYDGNIDADAIVDALDGDA